MKKALLLAFALAACGAPNAPGTSTTSNAPDPAEYGTSPTLVAPQTGLAPTVHQAHRVGWAENAGPSAPQGFTVTRYADQLDHPRQLYMLPNGDILVALSSSEEVHGQGVYGWVRNAVQRDAGALGVSANTILLLRDSNSDGVVDTRSVYAQNLRQPFGMVLVGDWLYVADTDALLRYRYKEGDTRATAPPEQVMRLPYREGNNDHWTRDVVARADGSKLYVSVGSASNIAETGLADEEGRAAIWELNPDGTGARMFASGIRNPVSMDFEPTSNALWVTVNERDALGDQLVPDYITSVRDGGFYGWPWSYYGQHVDARVTPPNPERVAAAIAPDFAMGAHTASLGLHFYTANLLDAHYRGGVFVGQHGSWNRSQHVGYKVVFVPFANGRPTGAVEDFLTGFLNAGGEAQGRPVGVAVDRTGAVLVADDVGNIVWRVAPTR